MTKQNKSADTLEQGIANMIEAMTDDFRSWNAPVVSSLVRHQSAERVSDFAARQVRNFRDCFEVTTGRKYAKVIHQDSVTAFVVLTDTDKKFERGDILKPAGYAAPARNAARGNVLRGGYPINWTGPLYLN